jgi:hypothetical protein
MPLDGKCIVDWGGGVEVGGALGGGFFFGDESITGEGVSMHVSGEHDSLRWGRSLAVFAAKEEEG